MSNAILDPISSIIIPGDDDGKFSIERSIPKNRKDFLLVNRTHSFLMNGPEVQESSLRFLRTDSFH
ncbi:hypothetical protein LEP1GSC061_1143 [Leptospira wolffii serovar Khorat str. Khorat-H2]|nr:hypothetical protein LEP1GSC061_1143 [Leptospira wolffii serovar Khorat str. Khorat-H2]